MRPSDFPAVTPESAIAFAKEMMDDRRWADFQAKARRRLLLRNRRRRPFPRQRPLSSATPSPWPSAPSDNRVQPLDKLFLPEIVTKLTYLPRGLILVTGPTGSGKSTTLAAMIDADQPPRAGHIITLEDPIEYVLHSDQLRHRAARSRQRRAGFRQRLRHASAPGPRT